MDRPYVVVNCAMSADGKIALPSGKPLKISNKEDIARMFKLRNKSNAILVGVNTVLSDNPKLTVKRKYVKKPKNPIRIILDSKCKTPADSLTVNPKSKTIIAISEKTTCDKNFGKNVEIVESRTTAEGLIKLRPLLRKLYTDYKIKRLMVEGGGTVIWNFLKEKLVDDMFVYIGPMVVGGEKTPTMAKGKGAQNLNEIVSLKIESIQPVGKGVLFHYKLV